MAKPKIIAISGSNGAGKSTLAPFLLRDTFGVMDYVNADTIAQGLSAFEPESVGIEAGRVMLGRIRNLVSQQKTFSLRYIRCSLKRGQYTIHLSHSLPT